MVLDASFYELLMETFGSLHGALGAQRLRYGEPAELPPPLLHVKGAYAESPSWYLVQAAEFDPEPLTVENLRVRDAYAHPRIVQAMVDVMAGERLLDHDGHGHYALGAEGQRILRRNRVRQRELLVGLAPLPDDQVAWLASALDRIISASLAAPAPPGTWCLVHSRRRAPGGDAPTLAHIAQFFADFNAFRDDAHMAAWQPFNVEGFAWEAHALVCKGEATMAESVFDALIHRGYARSEFATALDAMVDRRWLTYSPATGMYAATDRGRAIRAEAEALTDRYFYTPWAMLGHYEIERVHASLGQLRDGLNALSA
jgi:hypothetical protein